MLSLILRTASDHVPYSIVLDGLGLLLKVVHMSDKCEEPNSLLLYQQLSGLAAQPPDLVRKWLERIVIAQPPDEEELDGEALSILSVIAGGLAQDERFVHTHVQYITYSTCTVCDVYTVKPVLKTTCIEGPPVYKDHSGEVQ